MLREFQKILFKDFPNEPHMTKWVHNGTLQDPPNWLWSDRRVLVFFNRTMLDSSGSQSFLVHRDGILNKQFDPHRCESERERTSRSVWWRFLREKEFGSVDREPRHDGRIAIEVPQDRCIKGSLVEVDRSISVVDRQHRRDFSSHNAGLGLQHSLPLRDHVVEFSSLGDSAPEGLRDSNPTSNLSRVTRYSTGESSCLLRGILIIISSRLLKASAMFASITVCTLFHLATICLSTSVPFGG